MLAFSPPAAPIVKFTVTVMKDLSWTIAVYGSIVSAEKNMLGKFSSNIQYKHELENICRQLQEACVCEGNSRADFVSLVEV